MTTAPKSVRHGGQAAGRLLFRRLARSLQQMRERYRLTRQLEQLSGEDRERLLNDLNLTEADVDTMQAEGPEDLLPRMMAEFGMVPEEIGAMDRAVLQDIERVCSNCDSKRACRRALDGGATLHDYQVLCPNAGTFAGLGQTTRAD